MDEHSASPCNVAQTQGRKRKRVPHDERKRANVACANCRRLKEKCNGVLPCERCIRHGRLCELKPSAPHSSAGKSTTELHETGAERMQLLETVARHFLGELPLDEDRLRQITRNLQTSARVATNCGSNDLELDLGLQAEQCTIKEISQDAVHYSGEFSHWNFSKRIREQIHQRLPNAQDDMSGLPGYWRAHHLHTTSIERPSHLPPRPIAKFLMDCYFTNASTNTFFVDRASVASSFERLFGEQSELYATGDAPWLCTLLALLAVGASFAHLANSARNTDASVSESEGDAADDAVSFSLYCSAVSLLPQVIAVASRESVHACLLLAQFALPLDTQGLSYTYLGLASRMAIQNGMHRQLSERFLSEEASCAQRRLWWTVYRLEKRVAILHGRPWAISAPDFDVSFPGAAPAGASPDVKRAVNAENAMTRLTEWLGEAAHSVHSLRRCPKHLRSAYVDRLMQSYRSMEQWWTVQPWRASASTQSDRSVAHLHLSFHMNVVFIGRPFVFAASNDTRRTSSSPDTVRMLLEHALASASRIIEICLMLDATIGMSRASYTEFSTLRAAVLLLLARQLHSQEAFLRTTSKQGVDLVSKVASTNISAKAEAAFIRAIHSAITRSEAAGDRARSVPTAEHDRYASFRQWASAHQHQKQSSTAGVTASEQDTLELQDVFQAFDWSLYGESPLEEMEAT